MMDRILILLIGSIILGFSYQVEAYSPNTSPPKERAPVNPGQHSAVYGGSFEGVSGSEAANSGGTETGLGSLVEMFGASANSAQCSSTNFTACLLAAKGFVQVGMDLFSMLDSFKSRDNLSGNHDWSNPDYNFPDTTHPTQPEIPGIEDSKRDMENAVRSGKREDYEKAAKKIQEQADKGLADLAKKGYTYNPKDGTINGPSGKTNISDIHDEDAWSKSLRDKVVENFKNASSGQGSLFGSAHSGLDLSSLRNRRKMTSKGQKRRGVSSFLNKLDKGLVDPSQVAGMSRNVGNGDKIGVPMGSLFKTIQNRYNTLERNQEFLGQ